MVHLKSILLSVFMVFFTLFAFQDQANATEFKTDSYIVTGPDGDGCYEVLVVVYIVTEDGTKNVVAYDEVTVCPNGGPVQREDFVDFEHVERSPQDLEATMDSVQEVETKVVESVDALLNEDEGGGDELPTGQNDLRDQQELAVEVYPNPSQGKMKIDHDLKDSKNLRIKLHTIDGKMIINQALNGSSQVTLPDVEGGLYIYQLKSSQGSKSGTLFVESK